ncbi:MAG: protein phosphatase 2C domain-containing protein [Verrucomicrobia bacterium]|nr:protein phosphatase 2C domain-containing protein [Verrucomicrobiota bacterium]
MDVDSGNAVVFALRSAALSDTGRRRSRNEDTVLCLPGVAVFAVADGMGGALAGDFASCIAVEYLRSAVQERAAPDTDPGLDPLAALTAEAIHQANADLFARSQNVGSIGMGTTVVMLAFDPDSCSHVHITHAGDSRAYRYRSGSLNRLTRDHTVKDLMRNDPDADELRDLLLRCVGSRAELELEQQRLRVELGDIYMLCSDGLTGLVSDKEIQAIFASSLASPLGSLAINLVQVANEAGGDDNISVVLVRVEQRDVAGESSSSKSITLVIDAESDVETGHDSSRL